MKSHLLCCVTDRLCESVARLVSAAEVGHEDSEQLLGMESSSGVILLDSLTDSVAMEGQSQLPSPENSSRLIKEASAK